MTASFRLGRIAGIPVGVNWSVLIIFLLIWWGLSVGNLPAAYPGYSGWAYAVAGIGAAVVFFVGLLAHEVSHAVVAMRNGLRVKQITLWMFGGVAESEGQAPNPGAEVRISGVGPLVSLLISVLFGAAAVAVAATGYEGLLLGTLAWLAVINLALAVFNVLPAAPLDGGRLLRAALWKWRGERAWAAIAAARAGRVFGAALIAFGLWQFLLGGGFGGLWLALIGWFLLGAAGAEQRQTQITESLAGVRVGDVMSAQPQTAPPDLTVAEFVDRYLWLYRHTAFPLTEAGRPVGLVTMDRIRHVPAELRHDLTLREVACPADELVLATPQEPLNDLLPRLQGCADGRALVHTDDQLVGIVSPSDISRAVQHNALRRSATSTRRH